MSFIISPNMLLNIPSVGTESGPQFAYDINTSLTLVDSHDHSAGKGVPITPAGISINTDLSFNGFSALSLASLSFSALASPTTTVQALSSAPTSGINELWYTDSNGTQTQITSNGVVNATAAAIPGESYSGGTFIWTQTQSSAPTTPANFDIGSIVLRPNTAGTTNGVTLSPPSGISSAYTVRLPALPGSTSFLAISSAGAMSTPVATAGTSGQYMGTNGSIPAWTSFRAPTTQIFTTSSGTYTTPSPTPLYVKITAVGGGGGGGGGGVSSHDTGGTGGNTTFGTFITARGGVGGQGGTAVAGSGAGGTGGTVSITTSSTQIKVKAVQGGYGSTGTGTDTGGGGGGASPLGGAGSGASYNTSGNAGITNTGSGGQGGGADTGQPNYAAGGGGAGGYVEMILVGPSSTYSYAVGAAGTSGTGGATSGGAGGSGYIVVEEFYQ